MTSRLRSAHVCIVLLLPVIAAPAAAEPEYVETELREIERAYLEDRHETVIARATRLLEQAPGAAEALFLRGAARWRREDVRNAIADLESYLAAGGMFEEEARAMLDTVRGRRTIEIPYRAGFRLGVQYSDRVVAPRRVSGEEGERYDTGLRAGWNLELGARDPWSLRYRGSLVHYADIGSASRLGQSLALHGRWSDPEGRRALEWNAGGDSLLLDYEPELWRARTGLTLSQALGETYAAWIGVDAAYDDWPETSENNGPVFMAAGGARRTAGRWSLHGAIYAAWHTAEDERLSYTEYGGNLGLAVRCRRRMQSGIALSAARARFDDLETAAGKRYSVDYGSVRLWTSLGGPGGWRLVPFLRHTINEATERDDDFDRTVVGIDLVHGEL